MATTFQAITNTSAATKITYNYNGWDSMIFTNTHASSAVVMSLYIILDDGTGEPTGSILDYFLKNVKIPNGVSLKLEEDEFSYNNLKYLLYVTIDVNGLNLTSRKK